MGPDEREIHEVHSTWIDAVNAGDLDHLLTLMADDVVFLNPGQAPCGRDGFSAAFSEAQRQVRIRCISELEEIVVVGEVAYTRSRDALSVTQLAGGGATQLAGHRLTGQTVVAEECRSPLDLPWWISIAAYPQLIEPRSLPRR